MSLNNMNRTSRYIAAFAVAAAALTSCAVDNYDGPDASLYGQVIDAETGEVILQDIGKEGSQIDIIEVSWSQDASVRKLNFKTDGTYCEKNIFKGTYRLSTARANFFPIDTTEVKVNGPTKFNIKAIPYCRVELDSIVVDTAKHQVIASFRLDAATNVKDVRLFCDSNKNVSKSMNNSGDNSCKIDINNAVNHEQTYLLKMSSEALEEGGEYYFRVGALSTEPEAKYNYSPAVRLGIHKGFREEVKEPGILIDNCDDLNDGWVRKLDDMSVDTKDYMYGSGAITAHSTAAGVSQFFRKVYATPVDASSIPFAGAYLRLRLYVDKAANLPRTNAGQIELTSGGAADVQEIAWTFDKFELQDGWNMLYLPFAKAAKTNGEFDMSKINYFRIYHGADAGGTTMKLDEIRVVYLNTLDNCDEVQDFYQSAVTLSIDEKDKKEGRASLVASGDASKVVFFQFPYPTSFAAPVTVDNGYLQFRLYVDDADKFNAGSGGQIEISSSGKADNNELSWRFSEIDKLETGWNTLDLKLSKANKVGGDIDLSSINWFRIYQGGLTGDITLKLDNIIFYEEGFKPEDE